LMAGFAFNLPSLVAARLLAGAFGGPATSLALSVIADVIPPARRGHALGIVMSAFALASVLGVPLSLELAQQAGWRAPFFAVAGVGMVVTAGAIFFMPSLCLHLADTRPRARIFTFLREPTVLFSLGATFSVMVSSFAIVPNLSAYLQHNLGYPREQLSALYLVGGSVSYVAMRVVGSYVDRLGATLVASVGTVLYALVLGAGFVVETAWLPAMLIFAGFMTATALRNVALNTLSSRVPLPHERARFMSLQSAMQHGAAALGACVSSALLRELPDARLAGMDHVASFAMLFGFALPVLLLVVERSLARRSRPAMPAWTHDVDVARSSIPPG
jgi:predicted MFS family arabinose efflux permease